MAAASGQDDADFERDISLDECSQMSDELYALFTPDLRDQFAIITAFSGFSAVKMSKEINKELKASPEKKTKLLKILYLISSRGTNWAKISRSIDDKYKIELESDMQALGIQSHARGKQKGNVRTLARLIHCFPLLAVRMQQHISGQMLEELPWPFRTPGIAAVLPCSAPEQVHACMWSAIRMSILGGQTEAEAVQGAHSFVPIFMKRRQDIHQNVGYPRERI